MRQLYLDNDYKNASTIILSGNEYHHIKDVLRLKQGDRIKAIDRAKYFYTLEIVDFQNRKITLRVIDRTQTIDQGLQISLLQCIPKGRNMDIIIRMATEAGVSRIIPVISARTVPCYKKDTDNKKKQQRWQRIARQSLQQCGRTKIPEIYQPISLNELMLNWSEQSSCFFSHPLPVDKTLHEYLGNFKGDKINIVIGPEGGFSREEVKLLLDANFLPLYFGENILRVETASIYAIAAIKIIIMESKTWKLRTG